MDDIFKKLQEAGRNEVETLIKWLQNSNLLEATKEGEEKARKLFQDVKDNNKVELEKFQDVVKSLADDSKKTFDELSKKLAEEGPRVMEALSASAKAFKESLASSSKK